MSAGKTPPRSEKRGIIIIIISKGAIEWTGKGKKQAEIPSVMLLDCFSIYIFFFFFLPFFFSISAI